MEKRSKLFNDFTDAFSETDEHRALELLELSAHDLSDMVAGVAVLPDPVRMACQTVLDEWGRLDAQARVAALLVLANALAGVAAAGEPVERPSEKPQDEPDRAE